MSTELHAFDARGSAARGSNSRLEPIPQSGFVNAVTNAPRDFTAT
jgi:hypothetical protein